MDVKNEYFYFGEVPVEFQNSHETPEGWKENYYYRVKIKTTLEEINIEDTCGRYVPFQFRDMFYLQTALARTQQELLTSLIGAPNA